MTSLSWGTRTRFTDFARRDDGFPELEQVVEIPLELFDILADTSGAYDQSHVLRNSQLAHGVA